MAGLDVIHLIILAPGHFHAALLQKSMKDKLDSTVHVFAPDGPEVASYLALIDQYNSAAKEPTNWKEEVYTGMDYLEKLIKTKPGNVVVIAGNNQMKTGYIERCVGASLNVLADKPMAISKAGFDKLKDAFSTAAKNEVLLYDMMTERFEITHILQKAFCQLPNVFGELQKGTLENPAITSESVHYFFKEISGSPLIRPDWYFDVDQEGEGIVDVTTHLVDLIQWKCFPEVVLDYKRDIEMLKAKRWATLLTLSQFGEVTKKDVYPDFLKKDVKDNLLNVYANGEMHYTIKDIHVKISVNWNFKASGGAGDTLNSILRGTQANLIIRQGKEQQYNPELYIQPVDTINQKEWETELESAIKNIDKLYPGIDLKESKEGWQVLIPGQYRIVHEKHFGLVIQKYIQYLQNGNMPEWEISAMLAKYYTTTQAYEKAISGKC
jgi:predicted dehydrogenase